MSVLDKIKGMFSQQSDEELQKEEYIEIDLKHDLGRKAKIVARPFILREFNDVDKILDSLREGFTIALIDTKLLKFGCVIGDGGKIGVNSVLNPGTVLGKNCVVYPLTQVTGVHKDNEKIR